MKRIWFAVCLFLMLYIPADAYEYTMDAEDSYKQLGFCEKNTENSSFITRSQFISVLMNCVGYNDKTLNSTFEDVDDSDASYIYIANAENRSVAVGYGNGNFYPDENITVEEAITFISRAYKINTHTDNKTVKLNASAYALEYIEFAVRNNIYPQSGGVYFSADSCITKKDALKLIDDYSKLSADDLSDIDFAYTYPKTINSGRDGYIAVLIKMTKPCTVYYKINEATGGGVLVPKKQDITNRLVSVSKADYEITARIKVNPDSRYNIYLVARDNKGFSGRIYTLKNVMSSPFHEGDGTRQNPYKIYTAYQLEQVRYYPDKHFELCTDIEYNKKWTPIGNSGIQNEQFSGSFDGKGHKLYGLIIDSGDRTGFIASLYGGVVRNLSLQAFVEGENYVGAIAGESEGGLIENCHITGSVSANGNLSGGIVGRNNGIVKNCVSALYSVSATSYAAGISGKNEGTIENCISAVTSVFADMYASGVAGGNVGGIIKNCLAANIEINDLFTNNSGRITTNRENGSTKNNYAYSGMISGSTAYIGHDTQDGYEVSWKEIRSDEFYKSVLGWNFNDTWTFENSSEFLLPCIQNVKMPVIDKGVTVYSPAKIYSEEELKSVQENLDLHYILMNDITLSDKNKNSSNWTPLGMTDSDSDIDGGFTGTFDGNGYSIKNIRIYATPEIKQYGLFGKITGGTVRNLKLNNLFIEGHNKVGTIAAINYGNIENCSADGKIEAYSYDYETLAGGICAVNYINIYSSDSTVNVTINAVSATAGGITANNEGFIYNCSYEGDIQSKSLKSSSNTIIGGIAGANYSGYIYDCSAGADINTLSYTNYCGGILGIQNSGEVYKCSSYGSIKSVSQQILPSFTYAGGIIGTASGGLVMNSFTQCNISVKADKTYSGGIVGFCENASIQNTYSVNTINQTGSIHNTGEKVVFSGGIAGYNDNGNISGNVALNKYIITNGYLGSVCAYTEGGYVESNFSYDKIDRRGEVCENAIDGEMISYNTVCDSDFYFKSAENGGRLGWISDPVEMVWQKSYNVRYPLPILSGNKNQDVYVFDLISK